MEHYIISARSSTDRRQSITEEFAKINETPNFFNAIMGDTLSEETLNKHVKARHLLKLGEIGCAFSHMALYRKLLESNEPSILIFEDDISFKPNFSKTIVEEARDFVNKAKDPTVLLLRGTINQTGIAQKLSNGMYIYTVEDEWTAHAYIVNRKAAENLLDIMDPLRFPLDIWKYYTLLNLIKLYTLSEDIIDVGNKFESVIDHGGLRKKPKHFQGELNEYCQQFPLSKRLAIKASRLRRSIMRLARRVYRKQK